ncbi:MAG: hypothetical protein JWR08_2043 [Enterovirga sp.]|nr:hypothetical protein [Enterovirga sp.]
MLNGSPGSARHWRVLVYPGGTEIGLEINRALRDCKEVELYSAGQAVPGAAEFRFKRHFSLPAITDPDGIEALNALIAEHKIDFVYPAHDEVIYQLAVHRERVGATVLGSEPRTCEITRSKSRTYEALAGIVATPAVYGTGTPPRFPVFGKPDRGQGSQGARRIDDADALRAAREVESDLLVTEFLPGREYTVDCFSSRRRGLIFARGRERLRMRSGIAMQSRLATDSRFADIGRRIESVLPMRGAWFFQMRCDRDGELTLLEIGPRVAGTMALNRVTGVNFPLLTIFDAAGLDVDALAFEGEVEISRSLENHYRLDFDYSAVYVDLDDTLIVNDHVNTRLVRFLYQCLNNRKPIYLVTRHRYDVAATLKRFRLSELFDDIYHLDDELICKSRFINEDDAIFIDDSFKERSRVAGACGIRTFDASGVECLIDDRA